jgi:hypothetical protein
VVKKKKPVREFTAKALAYFAMIEELAQDDPDSRFADNLRRTLESEKRACLRNPHWRPPGDLRNICLFSGTLVHKPGRYVKMT